MGSADVKLNKIRSLLESENLDAVLLTIQPNYSWLSDGGRGHVSVASEGSAAWFFVTDSDVFLITDNIEAQRIQDEELNISGVKVKIHPWYDDDKKDKIIQDLCRDKKVGCDSAIDGMENISGKIAELRYTLTPEEVVRYKELGKHCGEAIGKVCKMIKPGMSEFEIAGIMSSELYSRSINPIVLLIAVDERVSLYRHPLPTDKKVNEYGMIVVCGRKYGLIASVTRLFHFGPLSDELKKKHQAAVEVDTAFIAESRPGAITGEILAASQKVYADNGYPDEWTFHHQGGPAGYGARDYRAIPGLTSKLVKSQAVAWNPSIKGTKSEDTIITTDDKPEIITSTPDWPMISVSYKDETWKRPDILILDK
ncbi:M24 family metallopeptidase [Candidatus Poribacteria bacterium]|nr:M24 family metallopeptidase [Candidatus Poribacteria bacterium]